MNPRNFLIAIGLFIVLIVAFVVVGNLLNALLPLLATAIIAFILGRLSVRFNLMDFIRSARTARTEQQQSNVLKTAGSLLEKAIPSAKPAATTTAAAPPAPAKAAEPIPEKAINPDLLLDPKFEIKTSEQIEIEARLAEKEAQKRAASSDVNAALEERRKRLLGDQGKGG